MPNLIKCICWGFFTGIACSMPLGPAAIEAVNRSINQHFWNGLKVCFGAVLADLTYIMIINLGFFSVLSENIFFESFFFIICGIIILVLSDSSKLQKYLSNKPYLNEMTVGYLLTLCNPLTFSLWLTVSSTLFSYWQNISKPFLAICVIFILLGCITWYTFLNYAIWTGKKKLSILTKSNFTQILTKVVLISIGVFFIGLGIIKLITYIKI